MSGGMFRDPAFRKSMRISVIVIPLLLLMLAAESALGVLAPHLWPLVFSIAVSMVVLVLVFPMEILKHKPIVRLFSCIGFFWVSILFGMIMVDYLTR